MLGYDGVRIQARVRAGASRYASRIGGENRDRSVTLADAQITWFPAAMFAVSPTVQQYRARGEATATFLGASLITASSSGSLWATAGTWSADRIDDLQWAAGARLQLHPNVSLEGSARHNAFDPLYLQPSQTSWSVGISVLLGRARVVAPPVPDETVRPPSSLGEQAKQSVSPTAEISFVERLMCVSRAAARSARRRLRLVAWNSQRVVD